MIKIGFGDVPIFDRRKSRTIWNVSGDIIFKGKCSIGHGSKIGIGGKVTFGQNFVITAESTIVCNKAILFGDNVLISWECQIMDTDFHKIFVGDNWINHDNPIEIGSNVWIGSRVTILKGSIVGNGSIIASGSIITSKHFETNVIIGGVPGKILKNNVTWQR